MTDVSLIHQFKVLSEKIEESANEFPQWKKKLLEAEVLKLWQIVETKERRFTARRMHT